APSGGEHMPAAPGLFATGRETPRPSPSALALAAAGLTSAPTSTPAARTPTRLLNLGAGGHSLGELPSPGLTVGSGALDGGGLLDLGSTDPLWVLDANKAIVVTPGVTHHDFSEWDVDLRAQVSGATVSTYYWDLTNAPDATSV